MRHSNIRDQIMLMDPIPQVSKVFSLVQQQEKQHQMLLGTSASDSMALLSRNMSTNFKPFNRPYCHHSKIQGHALEDCFKEGNAKPPTCSHCNQNGHLAEKCYKLLGYPPGHKLYNRVKRPNIHTRQTNMVAAEDFSKNHTEKMDLISTQYQKILQLLHEKHNPTTNTHFSMASNPTSSIDLISWTTIGLGEMKNDNSPCSPSNSVDPNTTSSPQTCASHDSPSNLPFSDHSHSSIPSPSSSPHIPIRKSDRMKQALKYLQDFHCQMVSLNSSSPIQATMHEVLPGIISSHAFFISFSWDVRDRPS
uniref:CCHC-type domain-containing protein n=1 Tax=Salix viminalis TaxID=40686 RepID=A0A6N2LXX9_SALVM